jgi:hypothetical protein
MFKNFLKPKELFILKKNKRYFINKKYSLSIFFKKGICVLHAGNRLVKIHIPIIFPKTSISQFAFPKKPFSGPYRKGKM